MRRKVCSRCGRDLPAEKFAKHPYFGGGLQAWCRECFSAYKKDYRKRPEVRERRKEQRRCTA